MGWDGGQRHPRPGNGVSQASTDMRGLLVSAATGADEVDPPPFVLMNENVYTYRRG